jgi:hypothetical protein
MNRKTTFVALGCSAVLTAITLPVWAHNGEDHSKSAASQTTKPTHGMPDAKTMPGTGHAGMNHSGTATQTGLEAPKALPPLPASLPGWMSNRDSNHVFYKRGPYNFDVYKVPKLAYDLNAVAVGHSMAYEDLVTGRAAGLETETFNRINAVLNNPPKLMPDEKFISPTFGRKYGVLEQMFDWTHILHAQTIDVLASPDLTEAQKELEIGAIYRYYAENVPYNITPLPMNMGWLDSQPYSKAFRTKYPKVNGLFWGYHWLQTGMHDLGYGKTTAQINADYEAMGKQYHEVELYRTDRPFMPMFAETSPRFAAKFPEIANVSDNLHMLHDMVNDILASDWMSDAQKREQITRAMFIVSADAHRECKAGEDRGVIDGVSHDHRFMPGMPGMGMMPEGMGHGAKGMKGMEHGATHTMPGGKVMPGAAHGTTQPNAPAKPADAKPSTGKAATGEHAGH